MNNFSASNQPSASCLESAVNKNKEKKDRVRKIAVMSSVQLKTSTTEERMNMYENMVEDLVNSDESSRYMLDGKTA